MQDWKPQKIIEELHRKGTSLRRLARDNNYSTPTVVTRALRQPYPKSERIIAAALGLRAEEIWPERYAKRRQRFERLYGSAVEIA